MNGEIAILILIHSTRIILNKFSYLWLEIIICHLLSPFIKKYNCVNHVSNAEIYAECTMALCSLRSAWYAPNGVSDDKISRAIVSLPRIAASNAE